MDRLKNIIININTIALLLLVLFLNLGTVGTTSENLTYLQFSVYLSYFGILFIVLYILYKMIFKEGFRKKEFIILLLIICGYFSYHFALDKEIALIGTKSRFEGLKSLITYYSVFLVASTLPKNKQQKIINFFIITLFFQIIIGTIQTLQITNILGYDRSTSWTANFKFASGTFGNPNFYSTYMLMGLIYVYGCLLKSKNRKDLITNLILSIIFGYGLIIGDTSSCIISAIIIIVFTLLLKINKNNIKKLITFISAISISVILLTSILNSLCNNIIKERMSDNVNEIINIFETGITDETGNYRVYVWKKIFNYLPDYLYTGIGVDNFGIINNGSFICAEEGTKKQQCFDKAHNEYLQILITEGIFTLIIYLIFIFNTIYISIKKIKNNKTENNHRYILLLVFISYLIQAFFNISVITVAPIYYMINGFLNSDRGEDSYES